MPTCTCERTLKDGIENHHECQLNSSADKQSNDNDEFDYQNNSAVSHTDNIVKNDDDDDDGDGDEEEEEEEDIDNVVTPVISR
ncbi:hypothetical protein HZH68_011644 [Vespula germanica]|uniref:Uncharacterized protein n=1 Tax=Vespula germanica TaxID=30212 RepID=A0A834JMG5_VESGE|nr:hypothetical protein HZH68_011644 [Vespula germanica]